MDDQRRARAPYNFVPFSNKVIRRYGASYELPPHDTWEPELLTGEIAVTLTAETPVFISDGEKEGKADFFQGPDGRYQIPGSTLRGLIRQNMQILGLGLMRPGVDFENIRLYYRALARKRSSLGGNLSQDYKAALGIQPRRSASGTSYSVATRVKGGYLHHEGADFYIQPLKGDVLRIRRDAEIAKEWSSRYAFETRIWYAAQGNRVIRLSKLSGEGLQEGILLGTGWMNKQNHLYLFPREDPAASPIILSKEDELSYQADFEMRKNSLPGTRPEKADAAFWKLPGNHQSKPVFYLEQGGKISFGRSQYLRATYRYTLSQGLPLQHQKLAGKLFLDYPNAVLGYSDQDGSYRSRVSVGSLFAESGVVPGAAFATILGEPKPSFFPGYVEQGLDYNQANFRLRGCKQYWMKAPGAPRLPEEKFSRIASTMHPMPQGTTFSGVIRYRNLHPDELGLLLWCLRLDEGCYQTIGMGKPYGYGRVSVSIDALREYNPAALYASGFACGVPAPAGSDRIAELIALYDRYACELAEIGGEEERAPTLRSLPHIQDFFYLKSKIRSDLQHINYMDLKEHQNVSIPLETVTEQRTGRIPSPPHTANFQRKPPYPLPRR